MKKTSHIVLMLVVIAVLLTACGSTKQGNNNGTSASNALEKVPAEEQKILIAYFTRPDNTEGDADTIVKGGGPYGELGNFLDDADVDALSSASINIDGGNVSGNVEMLAKMIQENVGGDLFSIRSTQSYPVDYEELINYGNEEKNENARPELTEQVTDMENYDVVFLGFPNWWYDMPMPVYSFLESYDFAGKTVIPFASSAGSGFSDTISSIQKLLPEASVVENGLHIPMREVADAQPEVKEWLLNLGYETE